MTAREEKLADARAVCRQAHLAEDQCTLLRAIQDRWNKSRRARRLEEFTSSEVLTRILTIVLEDILAESRRAPTL